MLAPELASNPLIHPDGLQRFDAIRPDHVGPAIDALLVQARDAVGRAADPSQPALWSAIAEPLDSATQALSRAWSAVGHLNAVVNTPELREAYNAALPKVSAFWTELGLNEGLYAAWKRLQSAPDAQSPERQRIIEHALRDFRLSGVELQGSARQRFAEISERLADRAQKFSEHLLDATDAWSHHLESAEQLAGLPEAAMQLAADQAKSRDLAGYLITLQAPSYFPVLQYAEDRALRETVYRAYATRASEFGPSELDNSALMVELLQLRAEQACLLGFEHHAQRQLSTRMARSANEVTSFLSDLAHRARPFAQRDLAELRQFAADTLGLTDLQPWDLAFVSEKLRQTRYSYSEHEVRDYFTEPAVMAGVLSTLNALFGIQTRKIEAPVWHPQAECLQIERDGLVLGHLYLDLHARAAKQGGAWVDMDRARRALGSEIQTPIGFLTCNFAPPSGDQPALLTHDDVITLFHELGHALHLLLSEVQELGSSPFASVEWDAIELPSQFMENFCWDYAVLRSLTAHVKTGQALPRELFDRMLAARNFQNGLQTLRQIEFSMFDMRLHTQAPPSSIEQILAALQSVRAEVAVIHPPEWNRFAHSFSHIFAGGYSAGYYSYKWAEVLSADAYSAFEEASQAQGLSSTLDPQTGQRFLKEILAVGGSRSALESFVAFRGREPQIDALLRHGGMTDPQLEHAA